MTLHDLYLLSPELSMVIIASGVIALDLLLKDKKILPVVALIGLLVPIFFGIRLWAIHDEYAFFDTFRLDSFALFFKYLVIGATALVILSSTKYAEKFEHHQGEYYALILFSATGMMLLASSVEFITIYVALELTALPTAALAAFLRESRSAESGMKFLVLSAVSSAILLYGMVLIYGYTGTSHLSEIAIQISRIGIDSSPALIFGIVLITCGFGFKISSVPFQMWAPDVYEGAPTPITGFLSVASKAAGFAIILRVFYAFFEADSFDVEWANMIAILSAISMCVGNLIAIRQNNIKRLLAYSTVAQAGYLMVGLAAMSTLPGGEDNAGPAGILFYTAGYAMTNLTAFAVIIAVSSYTKDDRIDSFAGLAKKSPFLASAMTLAMISLIGIPPTVGFISKVYIFGSAMDTGLEWLVVVGVLNSVVSAYYYLRVVKVMFFSTTESTKSINSGLGAVSATTIAMIATFAFGLYPTPIIELAQTAIKSIVS